LALIVGVAIIFILQFRTVQRHLWAYLATIVLIVAVTNQLFSIQSTILEASGRDATLTGRTGIWETVLSEPINPLIGSGYASFWLGERLQRIWAMYPNTPLIQAHNGYIEVYLNLGLFGLALLCGVLWTGLKRARGRLFSAGSSGKDYDEQIFQTFGMAYAVAYLLYNVTEATFTGTNFLFLIFLMIAFDYRRTEAPAQTRPVLRATRAPESRGRGRRTYYRVKK
jgi:O-antigen ligase